MLVRSPEVNTQKTKYIFISHHQNVGKNHNTQTATKSFENVAKFKCMGIALTNQNYIPEEINSKFILENA
jgi:hypothetical protein